MVLIGYEISAEEHHLVLRPKALPVLRRQDPVRVAYRDVAEIAIKDPLGGDRRVLTVRLVDGTAIALPFKRRSTLEILAIQHRAQKRVRAARTDD
jgi:hypothetical protein